jgi:hypothetical protein
MYLFLDDLRKDPTVVHNNDRGLGLEIGKSTKWIIARDYSQFVDIINNNFTQIQLISFDHDISSYDQNQNELTGKDAANFLIDYCIDNDRCLPDWFVHSDNSSGNANIRQLLINYMFRVEGRLNKMTDAYGFFNTKLIYLK